MNNLAVLILTKNEEKNIAETIQSARQCTDEVILIDSGSTDRTVEIAEKAGARVVYRAWTNDFSAQRNFGLSATDATWVLYLDADEHLTPELASAIRRATEPGAEPAAYRMLRLCCAFGKTFRHGVIGPNWVTRLFPRTEVTWVNQVHEHPECSLQEKTLPGDMEHYTYADWRSWERKMSLYSTLWAENAFRQGLRTSLGGIFGHSAGSFFKMLILKLGFLDGALGTYLCFLNFSYTMMKYLKLHELQRTAANKKEA